jgi:uncharacterized protein
MFRSMLTALLLCAALASPSYAQDNKSTLVKAARTFIVPRYEALAQATKAQSEAWALFCAAPQTSSVDKLKASFQKAADAWSGIEFVLYGPISVDFRFERMAHWPERKNAVGRALSTLLSRSGTEDLTPERFAQVSAAAQGLTAIERILFEQKTAKALSDGTETGKRSCAVGQAVAGALARTSAAVLDEWARPDGTLAQLEKGEAGTLEEAATRLATDYVTLFEMIDDQKLGAVMGKAPDAARPTLAEGWRSGRSMRAIAVNLEAAEALAKILVDEARDENASLFYAFQSARGLAEGLPADIGAMAEDPKRRRNLALLHDSVHSLREIVSTTLPATLGVSVGFNSRDGD